MAEHEIVIGARGIDLPPWTSTHQQLAAALPGVSLELVAERADGAFTYQLVRATLERAGRTDVASVVLGPGGPIKIVVRSSGDLAMPASVRSEDGLSVGAPYANVAALAGYACAVEAHDFVTNEVFLSKERGSVRYRLGAPGLALPENLWSETAVEWVEANQGQLVVTSVVWGSPLGANPLADLLSEPQR